MKYSQVLLKAYYGLDDGYIPFDSNPLHNQTYTNVNVKFKEATRKICGIDFAVDIVEIEGQEPIECELVNYHVDSNGTLIIGICQDWG